MGVVVYQGKRSGKDGKLCDSYRWIRGFPTKKEAQTELNRLLKLVDDGTYVEPTKETVGAYLERWLNTYAKGNVGAKTLERYRQIVAAVNVGLGSILLSKLQPVQIAHFYATALEAGNTRNGGGLSAQTVLHYHRLLRHALSQAVMAIARDKPCRCCRCSAPENQRNDSAYGRHGRLADPCR